MTDLQTNPKITALSDTEALIVWDDRDQNVLKRTLNPATGVLGAELAAFSGAARRARAFAVCRLPRCRAAAVMPSPGETRTMHL